MMAKNRRLSLVIGFLLMFAVTILFTSTAAPVWAADNNGEPTPKRAALLERASAQDSSDEEEEGQGVHKDLSTFEKNLCLSVDQKIYTITECEKVVSEILDPNMSDLEKYYTLACWTYERVTYDNDFWSGMYYFDYYSHQWDSYGGMKEGEKSVCVGVAIFYATLCHAADLPCRVVRLDPEYLDHTINYIPDINGHAYYADVTENAFLLSDKSGSSFVEKADKEFAKITQDATDYTFDYIQDYAYSAAELSIGGKKDGKANCRTYEEWFNEFANHKNTKKVFPVDYDENGSGLPLTDPNSYHASYSDQKFYPSQYRIAAPSIWFLDDFYEDPYDISNEITNGVFDDQLLNVSGLQKNYDCSDESELMSDITRDLKVEYFPSRSEDGTIVAAAAELQQGTDYNVELNTYDESSHTATVTIKGMGAYNGSKQIEVSVNSAVVTKEPVHKKGLVYNENPQELVDPGEAECGSEAADVQYALGTETEPTEEFTTSVPTAVDAGKYYVWYKVSGDAAHADSEPQRVERAVSIAKKTVNIVGPDTSIKVGKTATLSPKLEGTNLPVTFSFASDDKSVATVSETGTVKGIKAGCTWITVNAVPKDANPNYTLVEGAMFVSVDKYANPLKLKQKTVTVNYKALKKRAISVKRAKAFTVSKAKGKPSYKLVSAKKGKKNFKKQFKVNAKSGKITVKKGLKKGTYKVTVKVKAKGTAVYYPSAWEKVTFKVTVK